MKMNKTLIHAGCFMVVLMITSGICFGQSPTLIGRWKVDLQKTIDAMEPSTADMYNSFPEERKEGITSSFRDRVFDFKEDGSVTITFQANGNTHTADGTWELNDTILKIVVQNRENTYQVGFPAQGKLSLHMGGSPASHSSGPKALFSTLILKQD